MKKYVDLQYHHYAVGWELSLYLLADETVENCSKFIAGQDQERGLVLFHSCYVKFCLSGPDDQTELRESLLRNMLGVLVSFLLPGYR